MSTDDCAVCKHHRATHFPIYPGYCRFIKEGGGPCPCPRFVSHEDLDMRDLRSYGRRQQRAQDELNKTPEKPDEGDDQEPKTRRPGSVDR